MGHFPPSLEQGFLLSSPLGISHFGAATRAPPANGREGGGGGAGRQGAVQARARAARPGPAG